MLLRCPCQYLVELGCVTVELMLNCFHGAYHTIIERHVALSEGMQINQICSKHHTKVFLLYHFRPLFFPHLGYM